MRDQRVTAEYPAVATEEFEQWAKDTLDEIHGLVETYRKERLSAMVEFMDFLDANLMGGRNGL